MLFDEVMSAEDAEDTEDAGETEARPVLKLAAGSEKPLLRVKGKFEEVAEEAEGEARRRSKSLRKSRNWRYPLDPYH